ncbi:hypothetical protein CSAL01_13285 [Colletotrichum salicis]|uniref:Uncharacterized protein n=1 Tax=Colletotrichum salicis TaxID=1209931 RepID=A0A135RSL5_9PEZI|nr:hypothetical protein CSAL01_13285 [Colletotrichum salicis]
MPSHHGGHGGEGHGGGGGGVAEVVKDRASVVVNEISRGPVNNEIILANRERDIAVVPPGAQVINEVTTTEVFPGRPGAGVTGTTPSPKQSATAAARPTATETASTTGTATDRGTARATATGRSGVLTASGCGSKGPVTTAVWAFFQVSSSSIEKSRGIRDGRELDDDVAYARKTTCLPGSRYRTSRRGHRGVQSGGGLPRASRQMTGCCGLFWIAGRMRYMSRSRGNLLAEWLWWGMVGFGSSANVDAPCQALHDQLGYRDRPPEARNLLLLLPKESKVEIGVGYLVEKGGSERRGQNGRHALKRWQAIAFENGEPNHSQGPRRGEHLREKDLPGPSRVTTLKEDAVFDKDHGSLRERILSWKVQALLFHISYRRLQETAVQLPLDQAADPAAVLREAIAPDSVAHVGAVPLEAIRGVFIHRVRCVEEKPANGTFVSSPGRSRRGSPAPAAAVRPGVDWIGKEAWEGTVLGLAR